MPRKRKQVQEKFPFRKSDLIHQEDIYSIINYVQTTKSECSFTANKNDSAVIENILSDCGISYENKNMRKGVKYSLYPPLTEESSEEVFSFEDEYEDEIIEDGQCF